MDDVAGATTPALAAAIAESHQQILEALSAATDPPARVRAGSAEARPGQLAVALISEHLVAAEEVLHPLAARLGDTSGLLAEQMRRAAQLDAQMRVVERRLGGDTMAPPSADALGRIRTLYAAYHQMETTLVDRLVGRLTPAEQEHGVQRFRSALRHAPTRPHPHLHHGRWSHLVLRPLAWWDRVLDAMDNRPSPNARPRAIRDPNTPWGRYLVGPPDRRR